MANWHEHGLTPARAGWLPLQVAAAAPAAAARDACTQTLSPPAEQACQTDDAMAWWPGRRSGSDGGGLKGLSMQPQPQPQRKDLRSAGASSSSATGLIGPHPLAPAEDALERHHHQHHRRYDSPWAGAAFTPAPAFSLLGPFAPPSRPATALTVDGSALATEPPSATEGAGAWAGGGGAADGFRSASAAHLFEAMRSELQARARAPMQAGARDGGMAARPRPHPWRATPYGALGVALVPHAAPPLNPEPDGPAAKRRRLLLVPTGAAAPLPHTPSTSAAAGGGASAAGWLPLASHGGAARSRATDAVGANPALVAFAPPSVARSSQRTTSRSMYAPTMSTATTSQPLASALPLPAFFDPGSVSGAMPGAALLAEGPWGLLPPEAFPMEGLVPAGAHGSGMGDGHGSEADGLHVRHEGMGPAATAPVVAPGGAFFAEEGDIQRPLEPSFALLRYLTSRASP